MLNTETSIESSYTSTDIPIIIIYSKTEENKIVQMQLP